MFLQKRGPPAVRGPPSDMAYPPLAKRKEYIMSINENVARSILRFKEQRRLSLDLLSEELKVTKSAVQLYLKAKGNPTADTLELLAEGCGLSVTELVSDPLPGGEQAETMVGAARLLGGLPPEKREECVEHLLAMAAIFAEMQDN